MADSNNSTASDKKVKTEQTAAETIVGDASAEIRMALSQKSRSMRPLTFRRSRQRLQSHSMLQRRTDVEARLSVRRTRSSRNAARMQRQSTQDFLRSVRTSAREMKKSQANCTT